MSNVSQAVAAPEHYISFGKWEGYEIFQTNIEELVFDEELLKVIYHQIQLPFEYIRVFPEQELYALLVIRYYDDYYFFYLKYVFSVDAVSRAGYLGAAIVLKEQIIHGEDHAMNNSFDAIFAICRSQIEQRNPDNYPSPDFRVLNSNTFCNISNADYYSENSIYLHCPPHFSYLTCVADTLSSNEGYYYNKFYYSSFEEIKSYISELVIKVEDYDVIEGLANDISRRVIEYKIPNITTRFKADIEAVSSKSEFAAIAEKISKRLQLNGDCSFTYLEPAVLEEFLNKEKKKLITAIQAQEDAIDKRIQAARFMEEIDNIRKDIKSIIIYDEAKTAKVKRSINSLKPQVDYPLVGLTTQRIRKIKSDLFNELDQHTENLRIDFAEYKKKLEASLQGIQHEIETLASDNNLKELIRIEGLLAKGLQDRERYYDQYKYTDLAESAIDGRKKLFTALSQEIVKMEKQQSLEEKKREAEKQARSQKRKEAIAKAAKGTQESLSNFVEGTINLATDLYNKIGPSSREKKTKGEESDDDQSKHTDTKDNSLAPRNVNHDSDLKTRSKEEE